jgi:uncharacterized protein YbdZ (MbtH family)
MEKSMTRGESDKSDTTVYTVLVNSEEQYSIWAEHQEVPRGWKVVGPRGSKEEVLGYIDKVWTDLRPLSLRKKMEEAEHGSPQAPVISTPPGEVPDRREDDLIKRLSVMEHPVEVRVRPEHSARELERRIEAGYVSITFVDTRGQTELGVRLDRQRCDCSQADFALGTGTVHVEGGLVLNGVAVRCLADIELQTLHGRGRLDIVPTC